MSKVGGCSMRLSHMFMAGMALAGSVAAAERPYLLVNEDNDHYFKLDSSLMTREALEAYIDKMALGKVTHLMMCPSGQRPSYDSKAWEPIWLGMDEPDTEGKTRNIWCVNAKLLHDAGIDPYEVWIRRCRQRNISPWFTVRMNDVHFCTVKNYFRNTTWWRQHPEFYTGVQKKSWFDYTLDFSHREVRDYTFALIAEQLERYDLDGYELDWLRFPQHLRPGTERENAHYLTEMVERTRAHADKVGKERGRRIRLGVRIPTRPETAEGLGLNVVDWVRRGLVDMVVVSCFFSSADFDIDLPRWRELLGPNVEIVPGLDNGLKGGVNVPRVDMNLERYCGWADVQLTRGAQGLYLFNITYMPKTFGQLSRLGLSEEQLSRGAARYAVTYHDLKAPGQPDDSKFPLKIAVGETKSLEVLVGRVGSARGGRVELKAKETSGKISVTLNGHELKAVSDMTFAFERGQLRVGKNEVSVTAVADVELVWCEVVTPGD